MIDADRGDALADSEDRSERACRRSRPEYGGIDTGSLVDGKRDKLAVDFHRGHGRCVAEGAVRPALVIEPEEGLQVGICLDLGAVALQVDFVVFDLPPQSFDKDVIEGAASVNTVCRKACG
jgi:hypothetical protein